MMPAVPPLPQIVEAFIAASEDPIDNDSIVAAIKAAVGFRRAEATEENPLPADWAALEEAGPQEVEAAIADLNLSYEAQGRALAAVRRPRGWKLMTRPEFADFLHGLHPEQRPQRLSPPALETLAIIAYRQPVTKGEIESVRGVSADGMIQKLLDLELVKIGGRAAVAGRPLQYVTTEKFLEHFNLHSTEELPNSVELRRVKLPTAEEVHAQPAPEGGAAPEPAPELFQGEGPEPAEPDGTDGTDGTDETDGTDGTDEPTAFPESP